LARQFRGDEWAARLVYERHEVLQQTCHQAVDKPQRTAHRELLDLEGLRALAQPWPEVGDAQ
jgi:hypothetical protein